MYDLPNFNAFSAFFNVCTDWLYTLSLYNVEQNHVRSHIIIHWRSYAFFALSFCRQLKPISSQGLWQPNPYHVFLLCAFLSCLKKMVGSVRYHNNLTKHTHTICWKITKTCPLLFNTWQTAKEKHPKCDTFQNFYFKFWRVVKFFIQKLTRQKIFNSKSDALCFFKFKIWHVIKFSIQNHSF